MKLNTILFLMLLIPLSMQAQKQKDYVVYFKGDTLFGKSKVYLSGDYSRQIIFKGEDGNVSLDPYEVLMVVKPGKYRLISVDFQNRRYFMKEIVTGPVSLYDYNYSEPDNTRVLYEKVVVQQGQDAELVRNIGFRKHMVEYLTGCEELNEQLDQGTYSKNKLDEFIRAYNECLSGKEAEIIIAQEQNQNKVTAINEVIEKVSETQEFEKKQQLLDMLVDMKNRVTKEEAVPDYLWQVMADYAGDQSQIAREINKLKDVLQ